MKKKKSYIGWVINTWIMDIIEHSSVQDIFHIDHDTVYKRKSDCEDMMRLPDGKYKAQKDRITIEELLTNQ